MKISLGLNSKKYSHNLSRDCNTTFTSGVVQPIFSQYMLPDSDISVRGEQLIRLCPLVCPSFARLSLQTFTRFVPEHDIIPFSDAFYSQTAYKGGVVPSKLPFVDNPTLLWYLVTNSNIAVYKQDDGQPSQVQKSYTLQTYEDSFNTILAFQKIFGIVNTGIVSSFPKSHYVYSSTALRPVPTISSADFLFQSGSYVLCVQYGAKAKRLRNIFVGLGYSLEVDDFTPVRLSPLLSYFKAWFDTFAIVRSKSFIATSAFALIQRLENPSFVDYTIKGNKGVSSVFLDNFVSELADTYYSAKQDFVSVHRSHLTNQQSSLGLQVPTADSSVREVKAFSDTDVMLNSGASFSLASLRLLQSLTRFVNKNSVIGQKVSEYMRQHFGAQSVNSLYEDVYNVDSSYLPIQINDVFSTSDTVNGDVGEHLGAFAGKGVAGGNVNFRYHTQSHGYIITLASIVPDSGYFQGTSTDLFALDWQSQPSAEFDAIGMEATPRGAFVSHNDMYLDIASNLRTDLTDKSFGFVPRFSGFKYAKNIVNGDMSRRGSIETWSPYYLDHILQTNQVVEGVRDGKPVYSFRSNLVPSTSDDWRFVTKYPWLGNFDRIFVNETGPLERGSYTPSAAESWDTAQFFCVDDNYLSQNRFDVRVKNFLKPLSMSYDTYDEDDNVSRDVNPA